MTSEDSPPAKRRRMTTAELSSSAALSALPSADMYEVSYMHRSGVSHTAWDEGSATLLTASADGRVKLWAKTAKGVRVRASVVFGLALTLPCARTRFCGGFFCAPSFLRVSLPYYVPRSTTQGALFSASAAQREGAQLTRKTQNSPFRRGLPRVRLAYCSVVCARMRRRSALARACPIPASLFTAPTPAAFLLFLLC